MMDMLLGNIRVVPDDFFFEPAGRGIMVDLDDLGSNDAFEPGQRDDGTQPFDRIGPFGAVAQAHGVVIPIRITKSEKQPACRLEAQRVNELLAEQAHRSGAEDHDALFVQTNDPLIWPKIQQFRQIQVLEIHPVKARIHDSHHTILSRLQPARADRNIPDR